MEVKMYDMDTLEYCGSIFADGGSWRFQGVTNEHLISMTKGMPFKAVLASLVGFQIVYDIIEE
ncbi:MAG: hypothetical protein EPN93_14775 [Spirochaetes bacterium]|nr:MAG: hypothetical protein EPN93_14775 [Spirochaetota bacterium]